MLKIAIRPAISLSVTGRRHARGSVLRRYVSMQAAFTAPIVQGAIDVTRDATTSAARWYFCIVVAWRSAVSSYEKLPVLLADPVMVVVAGNVTPKTSCTMLRYWSSEISDSRADANDAPRVHCAAEPEPGPAPGPVVPFVPLPAMSL